MTSDAWPFVTVEEFAAVRRKSPDAIRKMIKRGLVPAANHGRQLLIPKIELTKLIDQLTSEALANAVSRRSPAGKAQSQHNTPGKPEQS